jgi:hypothetical protein
MTAVTAIEIDSPKTWEILCALDPHIAELSEEFNQGFFLVVNYEGVRWCLMSPETVGEQFDHIEPSTDRIKLVNLTK